MWEDISKDISKDVRATIDRLDTGILDHHHVTQNPNRYLPGAVHSPRCIPVKTIRISTAGMQDVVTTKWVHDMHLACMVPVQ